MKSKLTITAGVILLSLVACYVWFSRDAAETNEPSVVRVEMQRQKTSNHSPASSTPADKAAPKAPSQSNQSKRPPSKPKVSVEATTEMKHTATQTAAAFDAAVDDETGKRSRWFQQLKTWHQLLETASQSGLREDLYALVPITAAFFARDREAEPLAEPLDDLRHWMQHPAPFIIRELAKATAENGGQLDAETTSIAAQVFSVRGFVSEPDWEDERLPLDAAGILIAMPIDARQLEQLPIAQLSYLIRSQNADAFFRRYQQSGDGMPVLRQRYSANREALHSSFNNMASKVAAYQASTQPK
jgi:hypothetical protein